MYCGRAHQRRRRHVTVAIGQWNGEPHRRAMPLFTMDPHPSAVQFHELVADGQSQAAAFAGMIRSHLPERLERHRQVLAGDARTAVLDFHDGVAIDDVCLHANPTRGGETSGVGQQVEQHLADAGAVEPEQRQCVRNLHHQAQLARFRPAAHDVGCLAHDLCQVRRLAMHGHAAGFDLGQIEHVVDEVREMFRATVDRHHVATVLAGQSHAAIALRRHDHHFAEANDEVQRRAQFVADVGDEVRLEAIGFFRGLTSKHECFGRAFQPDVGFIQALKRELCLSPAVLRLLGVALRFACHIQRPGQRSQQPAGTQPRREGRQPEHGYLCRQHGPRQPQRARADGEDQCSAAQRGVPGRAVSHQQGDDQDDQAVQVQQPRCP